MLRPRPLSRKAISSVPCPTAALLHALLHYGMAFKELNGLESREEDSDFAIPSEEVKGQDHGNQ